MATIQSLLKWASQTLTNSPSGMRDAQILLQEVLHCDQATLYSWPGQAVTTAQVKNFQKYIERRKQGEPVAYILEHKAFWTIKLKINSTTLIPREETEGLIELLLEKLPTSSVNILELGTGSGAIALALAKERPQWKIVATDYHMGVLAIAQENAKLNHITNVEFRCGNWFDIVQERFDAIVSNPPYIAKNDPHLSLGDLRFEPIKALVSGKTGLEALEQIINKAKKYLVPHGIIALEHGACQGELVQKLLKEAGFEHMEMRYDLAHLPRIGFAFMTSD